MAQLNVVYKEGENIHIEDLGYRNSSYILRINEKIFQFPTEDEAWEYIDELFSDSGE